MKSLRLLKGFVAVFLIIAFLVPAGTNFKVHAASYKTGIYKVNTESTPLNVRTCYGADYMKVGELSKGTKVNVTFVSENGWGKIVYGDIHGWICLEYCKYVEPSENPETEASKASNENISYGISPDNLTWVTGWKQEFSKTSGLCTSSATASLLRRRQAAEGKEVTITFGDVRAAMGGNPIPDKNGKYESCNSYFSDTTPFTHLQDKSEQSDEEQDVYYLIKETDKNHTHNREYLADLLDVHPEGVVVYTTYGSSGRHGILISDYVRKADGSLKFYAYDPANGTGRCRLEDTWVMSKIGSVGQYFSNVISIWYVKGELTVNDDHFDHPEAQAVNETVTVAKKKAYTYASPKTKSERVEKLTKGDSLEVCYVVTDKDGNEWYITEDDTYISAESVKISK
ncbi:MAG: SH3 domain-containing protein [Lachnospiraceae bacterium]|nr:SH3 domain-containing protein [Lachnospiraceae bacterium]